MNKALIGIFSFALGAAAGAFVSWKLLDNKYKTLADEEIADVKERYKELYGDVEITPSVELKKDKKQDMVEYVNKVAKEGYVNYSNADTIEPDQPTKPERKIEPNPSMHKVSSDDWDDDYDIETLFYYEDGIVADDKGEIFEDADVFFGVDLAEYFGEEDGFERADSLYIRNDNTRIEYEILREERNYSDTKYGSSGPR